MVGDRVDVEKDGSWDMSREIFRFSVAIFRRHEETRVDDREIRCAELLSQPIR